MPLKNSRLSRRGLLASGAGIGVGFGLTGLLAARCQAQSDKATAPITPSVRPAVAAGASTASLRFATLAAAKASRNGTAATVGIATRGESTWIRWTEDMGPLDAAGRDYWWFINASGAGYVYSPTDANILTEIGASADGLSDISHVVAAAVSLVARNGRSLRFSGALRWIADATVVFPHDNVTVQLASDCRLEKASGSYYPMIVLRGRNCHFAGEQGNLVIVTTQEKVEADAATGPNGLRGTWKVRNPWDIVFWSRRRIGVVDYQNPGAMTWLPVIDRQTQAPTVTVRQVLPDAVDYTLETPVARMGVLVLRDCRDSSIIGVHVQRGSLVSEAEHMAPTGIIISNNVLDGGGQIRLTTLGLEFFRFISPSFVPMVSPTLHHVGWKITNNQITGDLPADFFGDGRSAAVGGKGTGRYIKFPERVDGITVDSGAENGIIEGNAIKLVHGDGIRISSVRQVAVRNNHITDSGLSGLGPENTTAAPRSKDVTVTGNVIERSTFDGIDFNFGGTVVVSGLLQMQTRMRRPEEWVEEANWTITDNTISWNGLSGLRQTPDSTGQEGGCGIFMWSIANVVITGNTISNNNFAGIEGDGARNITVRYNTFTNNGRVNDPRPRRHAGIAVIGWQGSVFGPNDFGGNSGAGAQHYDMYQEPLTRHDPAGNVPNYRIDTTRNVYVDR